MNFSLQILGTASAMPISDKNPSAHALQVQGRLLLIDCGEGTQQQFRRMHLSFLKVEAIFITHIHGDHVFGLFGMLSTMSMYGRTEALKIFGPQNLGPIVNFYKSYFGNEVNFPVEFCSVKADTLTEIYQNKNVKVSAFPLRHKIECYGYRFDEILTKRQAETKKPRSYAYCSDTMQFDELAEYVKGVSVLYHEATYPAEFADKAKARFHSTTTDAATCALKAGVQRLIVGHYTSRERNTEIFQQECRKIFENSFAAQDGDVFEIPYLSEIEQ